MNMNIHILVKNKDINKLKEVLTRLEKRFEDDYAFDEEGISSILVTDLKNGYSEDVSNSLCEKDIEFSIHKEGNYNELYCWEHHRLSKKEIIHYVGDGNLIDKNLVYQLIENAKSIEDFKEKFKVLDESVSFPQWDNK